MKEFVISEAKVETAVLVGLITQTQDERKTNEYLDELAFLAETAGAEVVKRFTQKLPTANSVTYVGKGKLEEIKEYINWCKEGDSTILKRLELFKKQKENVLKQMKQLEETLNLINFKEWYYTQALNDGTEINVKNIDLDKMPKNVQEEFKKCHLELK